MCRWAASILNSFRSDQNKKGSLPLKGRLPFLFEIIQKENAEKEKTFRYNRKVFLAEREGFEPSRAFRALHDFQSCALDQLSHLSIAARPNPNCKGNYNKTGEKCQAFFSKKQARPNAALRAQAPASWRTKPHSSFSSVRFSAKALLRKTAYSSAIVAW